MAINVLYNSTDTLQKKYQKSICDLSPVATNENIKTFVQGLNALSTNTITSMRKVETTDLLNSSKTARNMRIINSSGQTITSYAYANIQIKPTDAETIEIVADGNPTPDQLLMSRNLTGDGYLLVDWFLNDENIAITLTKGTENTSSGTLTFTLPETATYEAARGCW